MEEICAFPASSTSSPGPWSPLILGNDGAFYGTTYAGGSNGYGSIFRVTTNKVLTTLVSFANTNGANPRSSLLLANDGSFYGATASGGSNNAGTVFRLTSNGDLTTLIHFDWTNGGGPTEELVMGKDGALYSTTASDAFGGFGTIFRLTTNGTLTTLAFFDGTNGYYPHSSLLVASDGAFYGTTFYANPNPPSPFGYGNVFRMSPGGVLTSLAPFAYTNGANPTGKLIQGADGALYGTTVGGWVGKVFRVTTNGVLDAFVSFDPSADPPEGTRPWSGLMQGIDGAYYGTTASGGIYDYGTVFRVTTNGLLTTLASFNNTNGASPHATLLQGNDGAFYGATQTGGSLGGGNVFRLIVFSHMLSVEPTNNTCNVSFSGVEGETYRLLRSTNLSGPWSTLTNITLGPDSTAQFLDTSPPPVAAFYRTVTP